MKTIVAPITPLLVSSVIVVRISGSETKSVLKLLRNFNGEKLKNLEDKKIYVGQFLVGGEILDNVVFYYFKAPNSYTGEDVLEISFHGNPLIVKKALFEIYSLGILPAEPGEFTKRAFLNGKLDLTQSESVLDLINAKSESDLFFSFKALNGGIKNQVIRLKDKLLEAVSVVEAFIDFPEDNLSESEFDKIYQILHEFRENLKMLIKSYELTSVTKKNFKIAIAGKPNVGKSSLLNFMIKKNRAIVSEVPGTTRDYIEEEIFLSGYPVKLIDTAGIRNTSDKVEKIGLEFAEKLINESDMVLLMLDMSKPLSDEDFNIINMTTGKRRIILGNKCDKKIKGFNFKCDLEISVKYETGMNKLIEKLEVFIKSTDSEIYNFDILISERHKDLFVKSLNLIDHVFKNKDNLTLDLLSLDLQAALNNLSEITGEIYTEEILDNIFGKFCIGK